MPAATVTDEQIIETLTKTRGLICISARQLQVHRSTINNRAKHSRAIRKALKDAREMRKDRAEFKLFKAIDKGTGWAIRFFLRTQARDRGYIENPMVAMQFNQQQQQKPERAAPTLAPMTAHAMLEYMELLQQQGMLTLTPLGRQVLEQAASNAAVEVVASSVDEDGNGKPPESSDKLPKIVDY